MTWIDWTKYRTDMLTWVTRWAIGAVILFLAGYAFFWRFVNIWWIVGLAVFVAVVGVIAWRALKPNDDPLQPTRDVDAEVQERVQSILRYEEQARSRPPRPTIPTNLQTQSVALVPTLRQYDYIRQDVPAVIPDPTHWKHPAHRGSYWGYPYIWARTVQPDGPHEVQNFDLKHHPFGDFKCRFNANSDVFNFAMVLMSFHPIPSEEGYPFGLNGQTAFCVCKSHQNNTLDLSIRYSRLIHQRYLTLSNTIQFDLCLQMMRAEGGVYHADMLINGIRVMSHKVDRNDAMGFQLVAWSTGQKTDIYLDQVQGNIMAR